jgi:hypothetical protein
VVEAPASMRKVAQSERNELLQRISSTLQEQFTYTEIKAYLGNFPFPKPSDKYDGPNSKRVFANHLLQDAPADQLLIIAADLKITHSSVPSTEPPSNWRGTNEFKLFVSHIAEDKDKATRLKECLLRYGVATAFG